MRRTCRVLQGFLVALCLAGCGAPGRGKPPAPPALASFTGTWITDGSGAGGVRTFVQQGHDLTGHFDEGRGQYSGTVSGQKLQGRFWWNEGSAKVSFEKTPPAQRGLFEVTLARNGNAFTGRSRFETGGWTSWNGLKTRVPAGPEEAFPTVDYSGVWATDGTGAGGSRTMIQEGNRLTGHFDGEKGRFDGVVLGWKLVGRFWWNEGGSVGTPFEETPAEQRGCFEVVQSADGGAFTGRSKYEKGEWESWNGFRTGLMPESGDVPPVADFNGTWATDGTGAEGYRTLAQEGDRVTGHFDEGRGRYSGEVRGWALVGRFWWNEDPSKNTPFEETPAEHRGYLEVIQSADGEAFTGRSKYENGEWESWNGLKIE